MAEERVVFKRASSVNMWSPKRLNNIVRSKIRLHREEDEIATIREIWEGVNLSGYNFWIMGFAMVIACIGLNTNSLSAIIGAMLISPLMGPVTGYAFALATRDRLMRNSAIRNFLWMTGISLAASTLFFLISPFDNNTDALMAFSKASIFDILIAFFGGMAGFVGIMKKDGIKVMAGVAVATACMPPLCTAGFGLAHGIWMEFIGGLYFSGNQLKSVMKIDQFHYYHRPQQEKHDTGCDDRRQQHLTNVSEFGMTDFMGEHTDQFRHRMFLYQGVKQCDSFEAA